MRYRAYRSSKKGDQKESEDKAETTGCILLSSQFLAQPEALPPHIKRFALQPQPKRLYASDASYTTASLGNGTAPMAKPVTMPIPRLTTSSTFLESCYLLLYGELPTVAQSTWLLDSPENGGKVGLSHDEQCCRRALSGRQSRATKRVRRNRC